MAFTGDYVSNWRELIEINKDQDFSKFRKIGLRRSLDLGFQNI